MTSQTNRSTADEPHNGEPHHGSDDAADSTRQTINRLTILLAELKDYAGYYISAKLDQTKWSLTRIAIYAVLGVVAFLLFSALLTTTVVLFMVGVATALGQAFGANLWWLGWIIVGGVILLGTGIGLWLAVGSFLRRSGKTLVERYEAKREAQKARFGHHVRDRAADSAHSV